MAYSPDYPVSSYRIAVSEENMDTATPFAADLCVVDGNITDGLDINQSTSAALFSLSSKETLYAKNVHEKLAPASLTKVMTALVALKYGSPDDVLTASSNVKITESGAQTVGIKEGDQMTLTQALHLLLINSANDAAILIAEGIGGSVEGFCDLMNKEAKAIGATNSNFVNPHGLTADNHYVTAYDMYLIFNAALEYDLINEIIAMPSYSTVYKDKNGNNKEISVNTTNLYLQGEKGAPDAVTVIGGKTGTTNAAGHCLIILSRDSSGNPYISVILRSEEKDVLYSEMTDLLGEIKN
ncbi:MAG: D-alanyl-D-alanine carboxypeptidase [Clostridiales bacterium]|nr:D-alanyl-D-alanine carboxypeptidase [Clostridiales bacterium]